MGKFTSTKVIPLGSCAFRQPTAESHCRFIHGYRLQAKFWFTCNELDKNNWVVDFGGLKPLKAELEETFDHKTVVSIKDPQLEIFKMLELQGIVELVIMENGVGIERFAEFCFNAANEFIKNTTEGRCWCSRVEVWEHPDNSAIYEI
jgi:6-pyruvoyltetrahydropterin/6-carboxytetrahydropterin synthase